jgi:hypothetical protein
MVDDTDDIELSNLADSPSPRSQMGLCPDALLGAHQGA